MNSHNLIEELYKLPLYHRIAFAATCCERLLPNYAAFCLAERLNEDNTASLFNILDLIWVFAEQEYVDTVQAQQAIDVCNYLLPETEDFDTVYTTLALNAVAAILHTLYVCLQEPNNHLNNIIELIFDTYDEYLQIVGAPNLQPHQVEHSMVEWIAQSPLFVTERQKQASDLAFLQSNSTLSRDIINYLRQSSKQIGIHPIKRGLLK
ncbi:MAG: DUF416 family protein [Caldilineaceae bacterium]|nr:DUF416 family protein [Caldilineaceae bacterium]